MDKPLKETIVADWARLIKKDAREARDLLVPGFMQASSGHDCVLLVSETGEINAVCHDLKFVMMLARVDWYDPEKREFKPERKDSISAFFAAYRDTLARMARARMVTGGFGLQNLVSAEEWTSIFGLPEVKTEEVPSHRHHIGNYVSNQAALAEPRDLKWVDEPASAPASVRYIDKITVGDGAPLMSVSHPPCAMFPEKEESERDRIARVTREMCGG